MKQYKELIERILNNGTVSKDRTGKGTIKIPSYKMTFDLSDNTVPIVTGKKTGVKTLISELLWMLQGDMFLKDILKDNVHIWTEWKFKRWVNSSEYDGPKFPSDWTTRKDTDEEFNKIYNEEIKRFEQLILEDKITNTDLTQYKYMYGYNWKYYPIINGNTITYKDQLKEVIHTIKNNPESRRNIIDSYCKPTVHLADLPSCIHTLQFIVVGDKLNLDLVQRSADSFLGVPFDIAEYAILLHIISAITGYTPGELNYETHDTHIYLDHIEVAKQYLEQDRYDLPSIKFNSDLYEKDIRTITKCDFEIINYKCSNAIRASIAI